MATSQPLRVPDAGRHRLAASASLAAIAVAAGSGDSAASGLLDGLDAPDAASIRTVGTQPAFVPVGSDATHAYFLDSPAEEGTIDRRIGDAFSGDRDKAPDAGAAEGPTSDSQTYALTAGQRILNAFGAAPDALSVGPKWGPYIDFIARPGTPTSTGTIDLFVPVAQADDWLVFLNARGTLTSEPSQEAGLGGGVRHIVPDFIFGQDTILGVYGFVDFRNSSNGNSFVQGTIGAELITERFEVRINGYLPGSRTYTVAGSTPAGVALQGTNVVLTNRLRQEQALPGFDVEAGLRFELDPDTTFRVNAGYYRFERGGTRVEGGLARAELQFDDPFGFDGASLSIGGELRNDNYNGTHGNATLRFRMPLGVSRNGGDEGAGFGDIDDLMVRPVQRFDNVVAPEVDGPTQAGNPVTDAATGQTLQVFHVAQTAQGTGDCSSVQNACTFTVAQSLAGAGDTFLAVDIAGDIASAFALNAAKQRVVGAGDTGTVSVPLTDALNSVLTLGGLGGRPTVAGVDFGANANPFVRGIATNGPVGVSGNGFTGVATIEDVRSTNGGLSFQNTGATINVSNSAFNGGGGIGVALTNLNGAFTMTGSTVTSTGGGFRIEGGNGAISHDGAVTQTGAASAIDVRNRTGGTVTFGGPVTANTGTATGISLQDNAGTIAFDGGLDIDTTTGTGFSATGGGTVNVSNGAVANSVNATAGQAIDIDGIGGSLTFSTIASTGAPGDAVAIDNFGAGASFRVTGATTITAPGQDGIDIDNMAGTVAFDGPVTVTTATDDGIDMDDVNGMVTFSGPVTVTNPGDDGIDIEDSFNATLAFNGPVAITGSGGNGIELNGPGGAAPTTGSLTFGGSTTIVNPTLAGVLAADRIGAVTFADLDIALQTNGSAGLVLAGATINGNFTATDFDVTSTTNNGTAGVVLNGTTGPGTIQLGDANVAGASASIDGVAAGVVFNAASNATFIFGDGESATDQGSSISATTAILGGSTVTMGSYDFDDVVFTGALDFNAGGGNGLVFVAATATGDGSGSDVNNRANVITADAIVTANTTFVLINDGAAIDDADGFTLSNNQTMASFGNGRTFASGGLIIPGNFSGVPGAGAVITDPTGNGAATLTNTGAGDTLTALGGVTLQDFIIENTAGGDGLTGAGAIGINSTGLTIRNITAGQGIDLDKVTGTVTFNDTRVATTAGNGVDIDNSTVSFTGVLDIDTTTGTGFNVTGGSTVSVAAAGMQTIDSTAGVALDMATATVGAGGLNFDTVSGTGGTRAINLNNVTTSAGNGIAIGRANALNNTVQGIAIGNVTGAGGVTIVAADIDNPTNSGIGITGVNTGATFNIGTGTSNGLTGLNIDGGTIGLFLSQNGADLNIGTGTGFLRVGETTAPTIAGVDNDGAATGEALNIGNATNASRINSGGRGLDLFGRPTLAVTNLDITNAGTEGVHLANFGGTGTFDDLTIQSIDGASNAVNILQSSNASTLTFNDLAIGNFDGGATGGGFVANVSGTGSTNITFGGTANTITAPGAAVDINNTTGNAASTVLALDNLTLTRATAGFTLDVDGGVTDGSTIVTSLNGLTITGNGTSGGAQFDRVTFDAVPGGTIQQATGTGTTQIGQGVGTRVAGDGLRLNDVLGDIALGTLNIFNNNGTGLFIRDAAGKAGAFAFGNTGGVVDTTNGASVDIDPVTMSSTFASLTSTNSAGRGVNLDTIAGTFTVTGTTSVTGSATEGVRVINSTAAVNLGTLNVSGTTGTGVLITNNGGGSFTATGGTVTKAGAGDALDINGGAMAVNFGANISHTSNGGDAVSIRGGTTGNITVSGTIANTTGGRAIDINTVAGGTVSFTGATVTDTIGIQIANVAAGANVDFSAGTTVTLNSPGVAGINLSDNAGAIAFNGAVDINNAAAGGIVLVNANANVTFGQVDIDMGAGAANTDAISIGGTPGTLTFGVTTITNVGAAAGQKGIDLSGTTLGGAVNFQSVAISGPDTSTSSIGIDLTGVMGNRFVNIGSQANPAGGPSSSITDLHRGVVIDNTAAVQFTFGDGESPNDTGSSINVNGQAGAFTVDVGGGTLAASSFDFNDVAFGAGDNANLPAAAGSVVFVSQTGGAIAAGTHGLNVSSGGGVNTITVAAAEALANTGQTFVFVAHDATGAINVAGGGVDGFTLQNGQSLDGFDDNRVITFGTVKPANLEGSFAATGGNVTQNSVIARNQAGGATSILAIAAGGGNSTIRNTVFDGVGLGAGDAAISVDGAANAVTINNIEITNIVASGTGIALNNNAGGVALTDVDLTAQVAASVGRALSIDATGASTGAITVDAASDLDETTGTVVSIGAGARNVTVSTNIAVTGNNDIVIDIASQSGGAIQFGTVTSANAIGESVIEVGGHTAGTLTFGNVAITGYGNGGTDTAIELTGPGGSTGSVTFADLDIATANGAGLTASGVGLSVSATSGDFNITGGPAVNLGGVRALNFALTSITANGSGTVADGIVLDNLAANSSFTVTGATTLDNYTDAGIEITDLNENTQNIDFGATDINRTTAVGTGRGIVIDRIGGTGVDIDFGATRIGLGGTTTTLGVFVSGVGAGATGFGTDFASLTTNQARTGFWVDNVDIAGAAVGVTGTTTIDNAALDGIRIENSAGNVTFGGTTTISNAVGFDGDGVDLGTSAGGANTGTYTFNGVDITVNGVGAFGFRATDSGTVTVNDPGGTNQITSNNGTAVFINPTVTNITLQNVTSTNSTDSGVEIDLGSAGSTFTVTGTTTITNSTNAGIHVNASDGTVSFGNTVINNTGTAGGGVQIDGAGNRTVSFTGGLDIDTTTGTGFIADGSGGSLTLNIANAGTESINTTTGQVLNLTTVTIGTGVNFDSLQNSGSVAGDAIFLSDVDGGAFSGGAVTSAGTTGGGTRDAIEITGGSTSNMSFASATIDNASGIGIRILDPAGTVTFTTVDIDGGAFGLFVGETGGFAPTGTVNINGGTFGATTTQSSSALLINGGDTTVNVAANVTHSGATGTAANVINRSGGTVTISGSLTATGTSGGVNASSNAAGTVDFQGNLNLSGANAAISVTANTAGTYTFSGASKVVNRTGATGAAGAAVAVGDNGTSTINFTNGGLAITTTVGRAFRAAGGGTVNVSGAGNTIQTTSGMAIGGYANVALNATFASVDVSALGANLGIDLQTVSGSLTVQGGTITHTGNFQAIRIGSAGSNTSGGNATINIATNVNSSGATGLAAEVAELTGGSVTLSGNFTDDNVTGGGLLVSGINNGTAATVTFSGTTKQVNTGTNAGVVVTANTNGTVNFTNGGLDIDTTSGTGFTATGGGTVTVQGTGNSVTSSTGTAVTINATTIGAAGVTFQSVSANGGTNGIYLRNTGAAGFFAITGTASTDGSGGTIQNITGANVADETLSATGQGMGIYLENVDDIRLSNLQINTTSNFALRGFTVNDLQVTNVDLQGFHGDDKASDEGGVYINDLTGTATITGGTYRGGIEDSINIDNDGITGALNLTISGATITTGDGANNAIGNNGITIQADGGTVNALVQNNTFTAAVASHVQVVSAGTANFTAMTIDSNEFLRHTGIVGNGGIGVLAGASGSGTFNVTVSNNDMDSLGTLNNAIDFDTIASFTGTVDATIDGNTIGTAGVVGSGASFNAIDIAGGGDGSSTYRVINNQIFDHDQRGIDVTVGEGNHQMTLVVTNNNVQDNVSVNDIQGILVDSGTTAGPTPNICAAITGNTVTANTGPGYTHSIRVRTRNSGTMQINNGTVGAASTAAVEAHLSGNNTFANTVDATQSGGPFTFVNGCP